MGLNVRTAVFLLTSYLVAAAAGAAADLPAWTFSSANPRHGAQRQRGAGGAGARRRLLQSATAPGLFVQVYSPYNSPYNLPIPAGAQPSALTTAPNVSYPDVSSGGLIALAKASTNFGLRFTGTIKIPGTKAANYTFTMESDDGSLLYIDGNLVISNPGQHAFSGHVLSGTVVNMTVGSHNIEIDYFNARGAAGIVLEYSTGGSPPAVVPSSWFSHVPSGMLPGLLVQVYSPNTIYALPISNSTTPSAVTTAPNVNYPAASSGGLIALANATTNFGLRFTGFISIPGSASATFIFTLNSDDGSRLYIDGSQVANDDGEHSFSTSASGAVTLMPGLHTIEIDYFQYRGAAGLVLQYSTGGSSAVVPAAWFSHSPCAYGSTEVTGKDGTMACCPSGTMTVCNGTCCNGVCGRGSTCYPAPPSPPPSPPPPPPPSPPPPPPCATCGGAKCCHPSTCTPDVDHPSSLHCCGPSQTYCGGECCSSTCVKNSTTGLHSCCTDCGAAGSCCGTNECFYYGSDGSGDLCCAADKPACDSLIQGPLCCPNCQENRNSDYFCCAAGESPCADVNDENYYCCPPDYSCGYSEGDHFGIQCCPPGTDPCYGDAGSFACCPPNASCDSSSCKDPIAPRYS